MGGRLPSAPSFGKFALGFLTQLIKSQKQSGESLFVLTEQKPGKSYLIKAWLRPWGNPPWPSAVAKERRPVCHMLAGGSTPVLPGLKRELEQILQMEQAWAGPLTEVETALEP